MTFSRKNLGILFALFFAFFLLWEMPHQPFIRFTLQQLDLPFSYAFVNKEQNKITFHRVQLNGQPWQIEKLSFDPHWTALFSGKISSHITGNLFDGEAQADIHWLPFSQNLVIDAQAENIDLALLPIPEKLIVHRYARQINGTAALKLSGNIQHFGQPGAPENSMDISFEAQNASIELKQDNSRINIDQLQGALHIKDGIGTFDTRTISQDDAALFSLHAVSPLQPQWRMSPLEGDLQLHISGQKMNNKLGGTLGKPSFI